MLGEQLFTERLCSFAIPTDMADCVLLIGRVLSRDPAANKRHDLEGSVAGVRRTFGYCVRDKILKPEYGNQLGSLGRQKMFAQQDLMAFTSAIFVLKSRFKTIWDQIPGERGGE